ncbi:SWI/SNF complex component protein [Chloropicon primus]|uniref:Uncharacterized protein n=1 Tax=Chloropicon primus TaxID=1764295 RepID=A0A5B8MS59_9CHLO|nr:hypothetical protein A3770_07p47680 [Chloropicon primus]UPR01468.1 SWI/SNF complex component protein [Chloropicon primus]|eukprot:QDZ22250.1 hypothetical protein A3770_07p47680 [Chloropicon primus]
MSGSLLGDRRSRITEVAPTHPALKRKRNTTNAIPLQIAPLLPDSAFFVRLSQFEKRVDATLDTKLERVKTVVNAKQSAPLSKYKYTVDLYVTMERKVVDGTDEGATATATATEGRKAGCELYVYGSVELCKPHEEVQGSGEEAKLELTDVLKSVTVKGFKPAAPVQVGGGTGVASLEDVSFSWTSADYNGEPSSCLKLDCNEFFPGSKVQVSWEVKHQEEKFVVPCQISSVLGVQVDTKTNIISRLWNYMKLKGSATTNEAAAVEFTNPSIKAFFAEGEKTSDLKLPVIGQKLRKALVPSKRPCLEYTIPRADDDQGIDDVKSLSFVVRIPSKSFAATLSDADKLLKKVKNTRAFDLMDKDIKRLVDEINERKRRRNFYLGFSQSPVDFVTSLIESQQRDLNQMMNYEATDIHQRSHIFRDAWVHDASIRYLHQRIAGNENGSQN